MTLNTALAGDIRRIPTVSAPFSLSRESARNVMVCFSLEDSRFRDLIRQGLETAERLGGHVFLVHVETLSESIRGAAKERLRERLEGSVAVHEGDEAVWLKGREAAQTILDFARDKSVSVVVVGRSSARPHSVWPLRSVYRSLIQKARNVAIQVVGFEDRSRTASVLAG
jgi:two-component system, OmpR family, sensor histidine kinase KdpD